jgi:hypothetical protein
MGLGQIKKVKFGVNGHHTQKMQDFANKTCTNQNPTFVFA